MAMDTGPDVDSTFESIEWDDVDGRRSLSWRARGYVLALCALGALFCYSLVTNYQLAVGAWYTPARLDWLFLLALVTFVFGVVVPLVTHRNRTARYWRRFRKNRLAVVCGAYLVVFFVVGTASLLFFGRPSTHIRYLKQPALFSTAKSGQVAFNCVGPVTGSGMERYCHGSLRFPFGTDETGKSVVSLVAAGAGVSTLVALVTSMITIPIATVVGTVAGYVGGWTDTLLMRYVDIQQTLPAFLVYIVFGFVFGQSLFLIVLVFGLLSWGGVARLVRSEVIQRRSELYVTAAESAGASRFEVIREHILPNVSTAVLTAATRQIPLVILAEAAVSFIGVLGDENVPSWGQMVNGVVTSAGLNTTLWWTWAFPLVFLVATVFSFSVVGDALRDALDPRGE